MKNAFRICLVMLLTTQFAHAQFKDPTFWYPADSINKTRLNTYAIGGGALAVGSLIGLYSVWYSDYEQSSFHFTDDSQNWGGMDKIGHAITTYTVGQASYDVLKWSGVKEKKAVWYGGLTGFTYLTVVEVMDGFSAEWGFSWSDMAFNAAGSALFIGQQLGWKDQKFVLKYSYSSTDYPQYRPDLLGSTWQEQWLKDYNGQTYWLSASPRSFFDDGMNWWPRWLCLSGGYGIDGYVTADGSPLAGAEHITSQRQYYLSFDIDLRKIPMKSGFWKTVLHTISFIKIPAPTVQFNELNGGTKVYWLYF